MYSDARTYFTFVKYLSDVCIKMEIKFQQSGNLLQGGPNQLSIGYSLIKILDQHIYRSGISPVFETMGLTQHAKI
jgi:hypothetical protein